MTTLDFSLISLYRHSMNDSLISTATANIRDILTNCFEFDFNGTERRALVIYDEQSGLGNIITAGYRGALADYKNAQFVNFDTSTKEEILALFSTLSPNDLVVMIQSTNFRLDDFRIRIHLFNLKLAVIEHIRLARNSEPTWEVYVNAIAYDKEWYRGVGNRLKARLAETKTLEIVTSDGVNECTLVTTGGLEEPRPNLGDYTGMENVGGAFPIGEVFTEALHFEQMNGSVFLYAFADSEFELTFHKPFRVDIKEGLIVGWSDDAPEMFSTVIGQIKELERALVREIGFGMNRAISREHYLEDITAFERILGMHLSLGEKHSVIKKEGINPKKARFHVDVFPATARVLADGEVIFDGKTYIV